LKDDDDNLSAEDEGRTNYLNVASTNQLKTKVELTTETSFIITIPQTVCSVRQNGGQRHFMGFQSIARWFWCSTRCNPMWGPTTVDPLTTELQSSADW